jgi:hypothetical protein
MKEMRSAFTTLAIVLTAVGPALAADTTKVYSSGVLVLAFVGLCALVIVAQMTPAIMMLVGLIKGLTASLRRRSVVEAKQRR